MSSLIKVFFWGLVISFLGVLPLGTLNMAAMQIGIQETITKAIYFSLGCLIVEMIYVRLSLIGLEWIVKQERFMKWMEWATVVVILALAVGSFIAATKDGGNAKNVFLQNGMHRFLLGMSMSALNPVQLPFWFGWSTVLFTKKVLKQENSSYNVYIVGIGLGTLAGHALFIFGGSWLISKIEGAQSYVNWFIGGIFTLTALIQLYRILSGKGISGKMKKLKRKEG